MLRLFLLLTFSIATVYSLHSQTFVEEYNLKIYHAEDKIIFESYCDATDLYRKISSEFYIYNNDLQNALICALLCDNADLIEYFSKKLLERGAPVRYFEENYYEFEFFSSDSWETLQNSEIEYTFTPEIRGKIEEMVTRDQRDRSNPRERAMDDFKNLLILNEIVTKYGFPTEKDLGFDFLGESDRTEYNRWFRLIMIHLTKLQPWDFGEILPDLYLEGTISRHQFIHLYPNILFCDQSPITCIPAPATNFLMLDDILLSCNDELKKEIDLARSTFYLDSIESQLKKSIYRRNSTHPWLIGEGFSIFYYNEETGNLTERIEGFKSEGLVPVSY